MEERINLRLDKERFDYIEKYRMENKLDDHSEALRLIVSDRIKSDSTIFAKIKKLFF